MGFNDFWLQSNNGKKISPENFRELKKSDLNNNSALIRIFNIFDTQNADGTKGADGVLNKEELASLFNAMSNAAKSKGNASIFEINEAEEYIGATLTSDGKTLKESGVNVSDLFNFLNTLVQANSELQPQQTQSNINLSNIYTPKEIENLKKQQFTPDEIKNISIQTLTDDVKKARQIFNSQNENQGAVSDFVNQTKETFNTEYAASRVNRYIMREELCAELLTKSKSKEGLSEKEYLEAKIDLAVRMLPQLKSTSLRNQIIQNISLFGAAYRAFSKKSRAEQERIIQEIEIELLKDALRKLTPEGLTELIDNIASASDEDYKREAAKYAEQMVKNSLDEKILNKNNQKAPLESRGIINYKYEPVPGSIEQIEKRSSIYRKMTFEETFETERCVPYNSDYIMDYAEKDAQMQFVLSMNNKRQQIYNILHNPTVAVDSKNQFGDVGSGTKLLEQQLEGAIITALRNLYGDDIEKMQEGLNKLGIPGIKIVTSGGLNGINLLKLVFVGEDIDNPTLLTNKTELNSYDLVNVANKLQSMVDANYENALAGKTIDEYSQETKSAYMMAYGAKNAQDMAEAFAQSQQEGVQTVKTVTQTGAMLVMVAGQFVPVGGQVAAGMIYSGLAASAVGGAGISALENYTKAGGPTEEDKKEMLQELAMGLALVGSGMEINITSEAAFRALVIKNCPKLLAYASEIGIDVTMSFIADYAITGQIDFSGEGIAQLQAILVGILHAKGNFRTYIDTHAGDITTKSQNNPTETDNISVKPDDNTTKPEETTQNTNHTDSDETKSGVNEGTNEGVKTQDTEATKPGFGLEENHAEGKVEGTTVKQPEEGKVEGTDFSETLFIKLSNEINNCKSIEGLNALRAQMKNLSSQEKIEIGKLYGNKLKSLNKDSSTPKATDTTRKKTNVENTAEDNIVLATVPVKPTENNPIGSIITYFDVSEPNGLTFMIEHITKIKIIDSGARITNEQAGKFYGKVIRGGHAPQLFINMKDNVNICKAKLSNSMIKKLRKLNLNIDNNCGYRINRQDYIEIETSDGKLLTIDKNGYLYINGEKQEQPILSDSQQYDVYKKNYHNEVGKLFGLDVKEINIEYGYNGETGIYGLPKEIIIEYTEAQGAKYKIKLKLIESENGLIQYEQYNIIKDNKWIKIGEKTLDFRQDEIIKRFKEQPQNCPVYKGPSTKNNRYDFFRLDENSYYAVQVYQNRILQSVFPVDTEYIRTFNIDPNDIPIWK